MRCSNLSPTLHVVPNTRLIFAMVHQGTAVPEHVKIAYRGVEVQRRPFSAGTSFTPRPLYPQKTTPIPNGGCGPQSRSGRFGEEKKCFDPPPGHSDHNVVAIQTGLSTLPK